jgi:uncharacterized protein involved in tolerance to divalent cations
MITKEEGVILKLRNCSKYILLMAFFSCISLLFTNSTYRDSNKIEDERSTTFIETTENEYVPDMKEPAKYEEDGETIKYTVKKLPVYDANAPIVLSPLSYETLIADIK